jgi:phosphotransferase system HPr (HPr) family protein
MVILAERNAEPGIHAGDGTLGKPVCERIVEIKNAEGLHMRPALKFIDIANRFSSDIRVRNDQMTADGKSIMEMSMLAATYGTRLTIRAEGADAEQAVSELRELVEVRMFDEPPPECKSQPTE